MSFRQNEQKSKKPNMWISANNRWHVQGEKDNCGHGEVVAGLLHVCVPSLRLSRSVIIFAHTSRGSPGEKVAG